MLCILFIIKYEMDIRQLTHKSNKTLLFFATSFLYLLLVFVASKMMNLDRSHPEIYIRPISVTTFFAMIFFILVYFGRDMFSYIREITQDKLISIFFALSLSTMPYNWRFGMYCAIPLFFIATKNILYGKIIKRGIVVWIIPLFVLLETLYLFKGEDNGEGLALLSRHLYLAGITLIAYGINLKKENLRDIVRISMPALSVFIFISLAYYTFMYSFYTENIYDCITLNKYYLSYDRGIDASLKFIEWSHSNHHGIDMWIFVSVYIMSYISDRKRMLSDGIMIFAFPLIVLLFCLVNQSRYGFVLLGIIFSFIFIYEMNKFLHDNIIVKYITKSVITLYVFLMLSSCFFIEKMDINRYNIYKDSWNTIKKCHFMGAGTGFDNVVRTNIEGHDEVPHSHNLYISSMVDTGILGALLQLFLLLYMMYYGYRTRNYIMLAFAIVIYPFTFIDSPTYVMISVPVYFSLLAIAMSIDKKELPL